MFTLRKKKEKPMITFLATLFTLLLFCWWVIFFWNVKKRLWTHFWVGKPVSCVTITDPQNVSTYNFPVQGILWKNSSAKSVATKTQNCWFSLAPYWVGSKRSTLTWLFSSSIQVKNLCGHISYLENLYQALLSQHRKCVHKRVSGRGKTFTWKHTTGKLVATIT